MSLLSKRAWLLASKRIGKNMMLSPVMMAVSIVLMAEVSARNSMQALRENVSRGVPVGFVVCSGSGKLSPADIQPIGGAQGVTSHDHACGLTTTPSDLKLVEASVSNVELSDNMTPEAGVTGMTRSDLIYGFVARQYTLVEGHHTAEGDQNLVVIHQGLTAKNGLKVGDRTTLNRDGKSVVVTIVGLFTGTGKKASLPLEMVKNTSYTDLVFSGELVTGQGPTETQYLVSSADELGAAITRARGLSSSWDSLQVEDNVRTLFGMFFGIATIEGLFNLMLTGVGLASVTISVLVLVFWTQGRVHEVGILLPVGTLKKRLLVQFPIELILVAFVVGGLAALVSDQVSRILDDLVAEQTTEAENGQSGVNVPPPNSAVASAFNFGRAWLLGYVVVSLLAVVATIPMLRLESRQILSKMSQESHR